MKAIVFNAIGSPLEVLQLSDVPVPEIGDDEVLVRMVVASVNPGDFLFIQNLYPEPKKPVFPQQIAAMERVSSKRRARMSLWSPGLWLLSAISIRGPSMPQYRPSG
jgi:hypothetical protein